MIFTWGFYTQPNSEVCGRIKTLSDRQGLKITLHAPFLKKLQEDIFQKSRSRSRKKRYGYKKRESNTGEAKASPKLPHPGSGA